MNKSDYRLGTLAWALVLVFFGGVLLLVNLNLLTQYEAVLRLILASILGAGAAGFFLGYFRERQEWPRLIPAWTLLALTLMVVTSGVGALDQRVTAALLFLGLAAAFVNIYLLRRNEHWWALIPGGFMLVIGLVIALSSRVTRLETLGALLFVGMGLVFFALYWLAGAKRQWWALVPGAVLTVFGLFIFTVGTGAAGDGSQPVFVRWWPVLLIVIGLGVGLLGARRTPRTRLRVDSAPGAKPAKTAPPPKPPADAPRAALGEYTQPAPGATVEILSDTDE
ncbi:MAG: hypothetical protein R2851_10955 [Caldilineaceae bacterium]